MDWKVEDKLLEGDKGVKIGGDNQRRSLSQFDQIEVVEREQFSESRATFKKVTLSYILL